MNADWQKIQEHVCQRTSMDDLTDADTYPVRSIPCLLMNGKKVRERYKEYDGCYLGHYVPMVLLVSSLQLVSLWLQEVLE